MIEEEFSETIKLNSGNEEDVTNYKTYSNFVNIANENWRVIFAARKYKKYTSLHDIIVKLAAISKNDKALLIDLTLLGVSKEDGMLFIEKFMRSIKCQK